MTWMTEPSAVSAPCVESDPAENLVIILRAAVVMEKIASRWIVSTSLRTSLPHDLLPA